MRENNIKGWMSLAELEFLYETSKKMETIVELGSYLGRSTVALAAGCKGTVYAVDHWNWTGGRGLVMDGTEFEEFKKNTKDFSNISIYRKDTVATARFFDTVDMVFIDADHCYESVRKDIKAWLPKTKKIICGHDYDEDGAKRAVDELIDIDGISGSIWYKWL
jgi:hypothetical protein